MPGDLPPDMTAAAARDRAPKEVDRDAFGAYLDLPDEAVYGITPKQAWAWRHATRRVNVYCGSIRSGKTVGAMYPWIQHVGQADRGELFIIGKSLDALERNVLIPLQDLVGSGTFSYRKGAGQAKLGGRRISLLSAYDSSSFKKLRGATCAGWLGDELTLWPENFFTELLGRMSTANARGFGTTNPDNPGHWLKRDWLDRADELGWRHFRFRLEDNIFLPQSYIDALKTEYQGLFYQRFILGLWVVASGAVFEMFDEDDHLRSPRHGFRHYAVGVDVGAKNPTTFVLLGWDDPRRVRVCDLYYYDARKPENRVKTSAQHADAFGDWLPDRAAHRLRDIVIDPSALDFRAEMEQRGWETTPANNDVLNGIRFVQTLLAGSHHGRPRLTLNNARRMEPMIDEFGGYVWDEKNGRHHDEPKKENDHAMDALRYVCYTTIDRLTRRYRKSPAPRSSTASTGA